MITGKEYLNQTSIIGTQRILSKVISLFYWILITSIFTLNEIGIIAILAILVNISVPVTLLRVYSFAEYKISHSTGDKRWNIIHGTILKTLAITLFLALALGIGFFFLAKPIVELLKISTEYVLLIQMTGIAIMVSPFFKLGRSFLSGLIRGNGIAVVNFLQPLTLFISGFILFPYLRLLGLPIAWIISNSISFLASIYFIRDVFSYPRVSPPLREIFAFSLPLSLAGIVGFFSDWIDQLLVLAILGVEILGLYFLIVKGIQILQYLSSTLLTLFFPTMCTSLEHGKNRAQLVLSRILKFVFALVFPFFIFSSIVAFPFFSLVFSGKIFGGEVIFFILCLVYAFNNFREILEFVLLAAGYKNVPLQISGISFAIKVIFLPILLVFFSTIDIIGLVYVIELLVVTIFVFTYFKKQISISIPFFSMFKIITACGITATILFLLSTVFSSLIYILIELVAIIVMYLVLLSFLKAYNKDDFRFLRNSTPKILHPLINLLQRLERIEKLN